MADTLFVLYLWHCRVKEVLWPAMHCQVNGDEPLLKGLSCHQQLSRMQICLVAFLLHKGSSSSIGSSTSRSCPCVQGPYKWHPD